MKAVAKYPGSKWSLAQWITSYFPEHHSYLEPFFGSGAVLFNKPRSHIETVNDLDSNVVNLFTCMREDPVKLASMVYMTPYAREVYEKAFEEVSGDKFEAALNFYIRLNMGHGFRTTGEKVGWKNDVQGREKAYAARGWCNTPGKIFEAAERLRGVQIENLPAVDVIARFNHPNVLIYADPPYIISSRQGKRPQYRHEMTDADHGELLEVLRAHKGPVILSGYDNSLYNDALQGWRRDEATSLAQTATRRREVLWMNFDPLEQQTIF